MLGDQSEILGLADFFVGGLRVSDILIVVRFGACRVVMPLKYE